MNRVSETRPPPLRTSRGCWKACASTAVATLAAALLAAAATHADTTGSVTETISVSPPVTYSLTVSPASVNVCSSQEPLGFPNKASYSDPITVTSGPVAADIDVNGADAGPADGGTPWTLCGGTGGPACSIFNDGAFSIPGKDQYLEQTDNSASPGPLLTSTPQCDTAFTAGHSCAAAPNQSSPRGPASAGYAVLLEGPSQSTDPSATFTTSVTWTAVAP